jgi:hypothetical protein
MHAELLEPESASMSVLWRDHLRLEEETIFPALTTLPRAEVEAIEREIRARRATQIVAQ